MDIFSSRELASAIWLTLFLLWGLTRKEVWESVVDLFKVMASRPIITAIGLVCLYVIGIVYLLYLAGWWEISLLKNTLVWLFTAGLVSVFQANSIGDDPHYFRKAIKANLKLMVLIEFLISTYTFSLFGELLLVPFAALLTVLLEVAKSREENYILVGPLEAVLGFIGLGLIWYAFYSVFDDWDKFASVKTLSDFALPPVLSVMFLPFLYGMTLFMKYELAFVRINFTVENEAVRKYAKRKAMKSFKGNLPLLKSWQRDIYNFPSVDAVDKTINRILRTRKRRKKPVPVKLEDGWSPYIAMEFLEPHGLKTSDYHPVYDDAQEWTASTPYLNSGESIFSNSLAYYIDGDEDVAHQLKLVLDVNEPEKEEEARELLFAVAADLFDKAFGGLIDTDLGEMLLDGVAGAVVVRGKCVEITREDFPATNEGVFTLRFIIRNPGWAQHLKLEDINAKA